MGHNDEAGCCKSKIKMVLKPSFKLENSCKGIVCGIDEVGRGPLAGPVVSAAVVINRSIAPQEILEQINDSKKLSAVKRAYLAEKIYEFSDVSIAECSVDEIDDINILQAALRSMARAFEGLKTIPQTALVDGNKKPKLICETQTIVKGDSVSISIAAASIVAKEYRDKLMRDIANDFPNYGWEHNAGYGTKEHLEAIKKHGITIHHRKTFAPIRQEVFGF